MYLYYVTISRGRWLPLYFLNLKENAAYLKKNYVMHENDLLSEYNKIPLGHNRTNGAVYSKTYFKVNVCSALSKFESHPMLHFPR